MNETNSSSLNEGKQEFASCRECRSCQNSVARRKFLQSAVIAVGGIGWGLQAIARAIEPGANLPGSTPGAENTPAADPMVFPLPQSVLETVGAFEIIQAEHDEIIVARTSPARIVACSAVCTHVACLLDYDHAAQQFVCPCHDARFDLNGKVVQGPATRNLKIYPVRLLINLSTADSSTIEKPDATR